MAKALFDFKGQKVLITGGASGIGAASARAFAAAGAQVFATGLSADEVEQAKQQPGFESIDVRVLDVRDHEALSALAQSFDRLDVLVHCAGMIRREAEHDPDVFDEVLHVNLSAGMRLSTMMTATGSAIGFDCLHCLHAQLLWRSQAACLCSIKRSDSATHDVTGGRLRSGFDTRQRGCPRLDRDQFIARRAR